MHIMINELSFTGQIQNRDDIPELIGSIVNILRGLAPIRHDDPVCGHSDLYSRELSSGYTVDEWLRSIFSKGGKFRDKMREFLITTKKGPFTDVMLDKALEYHEALFDDKDISSSSVAGAAYFKGTLVSLKNSAGFEQDPICVSFSAEGKPYEDMEVQNLTDVSQIHQVRPEYVPSPKHARGDGEHLWTLMMKPLNPYLIAESDTEDRFMASIMASITHSSRIMPEAFTDTRFLIMRCLRKSETNYKKGT